MKVALVSLGCPKNLVDSEVMLGLLAQAGHELTVEPAAADCIIVNTCAFIGAARQEAVETVQGLAAHRLAGRCRLLVVAGCLSRKLDEETTQRLSMVDLFMGPEEVPQVARLVAQAAGRPRVTAAEPHYLYDDTTPRLAGTPPWTAYLKLAEGCSHRCAFCSIPAIRGPYRSRQPASVVAEARQLAARGVRELVLIAQDTSAYGIDLGGKLLLPALLGELAAVEGLDWIRLLYTYPAHMTDELLAAMAATPRVLPYLDLPLQHSHPELLRAMRRPGNGERYLALIQRIRRSLPAVTLRTSLIVGLPGETEEHFRHLQGFVAAARFDRAGVFTYSPEAGTPAAELPGQVPAEVAQGRYDTLMQMQQGISLAINRGLVGRRLQVLVEEVDRRQAVGRSYRDAPEIDGLVTLPPKGLRPGMLVEAEVTAAGPYDLEARPCLL